jgi:hypothetical protein
VHRRADDKTSSPGEGRLWPDNAAFKDATNVELGSCNTSDFAIGDDDDVSASELDTGFDDILTDPNYTLAEDPNANAENILPELIEETHNVFQDMARADH